VPIALIALDFDPLLHLMAGLVVRWEAVAIAAVVIAALVTAGLMARRAALRADDLLFIAVGVVPGAVLGGRIGYLLLHLDFYATQPGAIFDPARGGLELGLAVVGGVLSGLSVATLLEVPLGRWMHLAALPVLFVLGAGKLAMLLGGAGQGQPAALPWATAFLGPGPWASLAPGLPSHPAQAYEGLATLALAFVIGLVLVVRPGIARDGRVLLVALALWALVRAAVTLTWRDPAVVWVLNAGTLIALAVAIAFVGALAIWTARGLGLAEDGGAPGESAEPLPDPDGVS
jgi:phosphatidylglycerol:prolipoprotein diacylglycerol transferase